MRARILALVTSMALVATACGNAGDDDDAGSGTTGTTATGQDLDEFVPSEEPGVSDDEISVAVITSATNVLGGKYKQFTDGIQAYFDMVNAEGGIYGRDLVVGVERDDKMVGNQVEVKASLEQDNAFATFVATILFSGAQDLDDAGMPTFTWNINPEMAGHDNIFGHLGALCFGCPGQFLSWLAQENGFTKVGVLAYGVSEESKKCADGVKEGFEKFGVADVVFFDKSLQFSQADLSAQVAGMVDEGVEFVATCMDAKETLVLAKEMDKQGLDAVQSLPNGYDAEFMADNGEYYEGSFVEPQYAAFEHEPQIEEVKTFLEWAGKGGEPIVELTVVGWIAAFQFVKGLELAGPEFTQQGVIDALNTVTDMDVNGLIVPIDWTKQHNEPSGDVSVRSAYECASVVQVRDSEFVPVYDEPGKPWVCMQGGPEATVLTTEPDYVSFAPEG